MKISVVGSINMDMTITAERIPKKGETLFGKDIHYIPGGKGANQAVAMSRLGADVEMFGCVGNDSAGKTLLEKLEKEGVKTKNIKIDENTPTGVALITIGDNDNTIVVVAGANAKVDKAYVDSILNELLKSEVVVLQHEIPIETVEYIIDKCYENNIKIILNPAPAYPVSKDTIEKVTYLTPNEHEAAILFGNDIPTEKLLKRYPEKLLITQGEKGVSICLSDGKTFIVPARKANVVDTTGAGDTLNGAFAVKISEGETIVNALKFANVAASLSTEKFGAQGGMPMKDDVIKEMEKIKL